MTESRRCSLSGLGDCLGSHKPKEHFSAEQWLCLKARSGISKIRRVCEKHSNDFLKYYPMNQKFCSNTKAHNPNRNKVVGSKTITILQHKASKAAVGVLEIINAPLVPGKKLCKRCYNTIAPLLTLFPEIEDTATSSFSSSQTESQPLAEQGEVPAQGLAPEQNVAQNVPINVEQGKVPVKEPSPEQRRAEEPPSSHSLDNTERLTLRSHPVQPQLSQGADADNESESSNSQNVVSDSDEAFLPREAALAMVDASLVALQESPINKRKLATAPTYSSAKVKKTELKIGKLLIQGGAATSSTANIDFCDKVVNALQNKFKNSSTITDKIAVLSVVLSGLSQAKVMELFGPVGATDHLIRKTMKLTSEQGLFPKPLPKKGRSLAENIVMKVLDHYENDHYSRQMPGKKDYVIVIEGGKKKYVQKRLILCNLNELYQSFKRKNPSVKISFSKFASLRPRHCVFAGSAGTHSICVCKYHQNVKLMIEAVDFKCLDASLESYKDFIAAGLCQSPSADCYLQKCQNCPGFEEVEDRLFDLLQEHCIEEITFKQWSDLPRSALQVHTMEMAPFLESLIRKLKELAPHHFITKQQAQHLQDLKEDLKPGEALTVCDFSENYTFIIQDSIQGYYFQNDQATLHPFVTYYRDGGELKCLSYVVISDHMKHNVTSFYAFQRRHINHLKGLIPGLQKITYFSDGAGSQYKNVFNIQNLTHHEEDFGVQCEWVNFSTSHGKGPSDGIGGTLKRYAARASLQGKLIRTAHELYIWAKDAMPTLTVAFVSTQEVLEADAFLKKRFQIAVQIDQIRSYHRFSPLSVGEVEVRRFSYSEEAVYAPCELIRKIPPISELEAGRYVAVHSKKKSWYVAKITGTDEGKVMVTRLKEIGRSGSQKCCYQMPPLTEKVHTIETKSVLAVIELNLNQDKLLTISTGERLRLLWQLKAVNKINE